MDLCDFSTLICRPRTMRFCLIPVALTLLCAFTPAVHAEDAVLPLKPNRTFLNALANSDAASIIISAQRLEGMQDNQIEASGEVELRHGNQAIFADHLLYLRDSQELLADGAVRVELEGVVMTGPQLKLNLDTNIGDMAQPQFQFAANNARASADSLHMQGRQNFNLRHATYTTCPAGNDDWLLKVGELNLDRDRQVGVAHHARVEFMGLPILYTPWMDFPLENQRKSGFLGPVFGGTGKGGNEVTLPYYWNIAPNLDATIAPRMMRKRGLMLNNELRYLASSYSGEAHLDVLPDDRIAAVRRSRQALKHAHNFAPGLNATLDLNRVSDNAYFRDLSNAVNETSQTNLVREGVLNYSSGWWNAAARVQNFQTLQDPDPLARVEAPYRRAPQLSLNAQRAWAGANVMLAGEFVDFRHPTKVNGRRLVAYPSASYPLIARPAFYLTPKLGLHYTDYVLGENKPDGLRDTRRTVPIFSLDSGLALERDWNVSGQNFVQTLEPRAYYVYIPYRDQNLLPNFDSAPADFSFAQMFTENRFFGSDRISDANHLTLALTSRLLQQDSGVERLRMAVGQRFSREISQATLPGSTATINMEDILLAASGQITRAWSLDSAMQYNPNDERSEKFNLAARYQPESGKVFNLGYRYTRDSVRQAELSTQWPLAGRWQAVARWNYSVQDRHTLEALAGLEYNESCWAVRLVAQRFATATREFATGFFVQLELNDLVRVGADPLGVLRRSIPGYTKLN